MEKRQTELLLFYFTTVFSVIAVIGLWAIDIGASGMVIESKYGIDITATNGYWAREPIQQYHIGLWLVGVSITVLSSFVILCFMVLGPGKEETPISVCNKKFEDYKPGEK